MTLQVLIWVLKNLIVDAERLGKKIIAISRLKDWIMKKNIVFVTKVKKIIEFLNLNQIPFDEACMIFLC